MKSIKCVCDGACVKQQHKQNGPLAESGFDVIKTHGSHYQCRQVFVVCVCVCFSVGMCVCFSVGVRKVK